MKNLKKIFSKTGAPMLSARVAAKQLGVAGDYIGKLAREGKLEGTQVKGAWFVDEASLKTFAESRLAAKAERALELAELGLLLELRVETRGHLAHGLLQVGDLGPSSR